MENQSAKGKPYVMLALCCICMIADGLLAGRDLAHSNHGMFAVDLILSFWMLYCANHYWKRMFHE